MGPREILRFWFDGVDEAGEPGPDARSRWFGGGASLDDELRARFGDAVEAALSGGLDPWGAAAEGRVALVLLLDQLTRSLFRGQARAFAGDAEALRHCREVLAAGEHETLPAPWQYFLLMPLMHAEDLARQREAVRCFTELRDARAPEPSGFYRGGVEWAVRHERTIERFGRFPARNAALGRSMTDEEAAFLQEHPAGF